MKTILHTRHLEMLQIALSQVGIQEQPGKEKNNPEILKYFHETGHKWVPSDETAWCCAFVNWCAKQSCLRYSKQLNARSYLDIGTPINNPFIGCITVLWRESLDSWKGHVGLFIRETEKHIYILGGNQHNQVNIKPYPKYRLLSHIQLHPNP